MITIDGETRTIAEWAKLAGVHPDTVSRRLKDGWDIKKACTMGPMSAAGRAARSKKAGRWRSDMSFLFRKKRRT